MSLKRYLRSFVFNLLALWLISQYIVGVSYAGGFKTLSIAALALTIVNLLAKPLVKLLLLPINLLTLGAFRWLTNVVALYLMTMFVPQLKIASFTFHGFTHQGLVIPSIDISNFWSYVICSFLISLITSFIYWLIK